MYDDVALSLFREREVKSAEICIKLTKAQKLRIVEMAEIAGTSATRFIISLIGQEHERQIIEQQMVESYADMADASDCAIPF